MWCRFTEQAVVVGQWSVDLGNRLYTHAPRPWRGPPNIWELLNRFQRARIRVACQHRTLRPLISLPTPCELTYSRKSKMLARPSAEDRSRRRSHAAECGSRQGSSSQSSAKRSEKLDRSNMTAVEREADSATSFDSLSAFARVPGLAVNE